MHDVDRLKELLIRGIKLNNWILELPTRIEGDLDEWNDIIEGVSAYDNTTISIIHRNEIDYLIQTYEVGVNTISDFIDKRIIVQEIKDSILEERLKDA